MVRKLIYLLVLLLLVSPALGYTLPSTSIQGTLNMTNHKILNASTPVNATDAASKAYADLKLPITAADSMNETIDSKLNKSGDTWTGDQNAGGYNLTNLHNPIFDGTGEINGYMPSSGNSLHYYSSSGWIPGPGIPGVVTVGNSEAYDINTNNYSSGYQGSAIIDALALLNTRTGGNGGIVSIAPITINDLSRPAALYLNHSYAQSMQVTIQGSGFGYYGWGSQIRNKYGIMINRYAKGGAGNDGGIIFRAICISGSSTSMGTGIDVNCTSQANIMLEHVKVTDFNIGVNLLSPQCYNQVFRDVECFNCTTGGFAIAGFNNRLDKIVTGYYVVAPPTSYGIYIYGNGNKGTSLDSGSAPGSSTGSGVAGFVVKGTGNDIDGWSEPWPVERNVTYISGARNKVRVIATASSAPYGRHWIRGYGNELDPVWGYWAEYTDILLYSLANVTIESGAVGYDNRIKMNPVVQRSGRAVITDNGYGTVYDYGTPRYTAAPVWGYWYRGASVINSLVAAGGVPGWRCVATGYPGTWVPEAVVGA